MARSLRIEFPGALYHITHRGNEKKKIFMNSDDRELFLETLTAVIERFHWLCHSYVLMDNHYHLLIETPLGNLSRGMMQLNSVYTQNFNRRHNRIGHLFQGRFKSILVEKEAYLLELSRYITLNPVRARLVDSPEEWKWSSYSPMVGLNSCPEFLTTDWVLDQFSRNKEKAISSYKKFIQEGYGLEFPKEGLVANVILGTEDFINKVSHHLDGDSRKRIEEEIPRLQRQPLSPQLEEIFQKGMKEGKPRNELIYQVYYDHNYTMKEIGKYFGLHYGTISRIIKMQQKKQ
ncbi:MAG: REP-associated tyrosine transposase [Candidatus Omnitrophota bacterium]